MNKTARPILVVEDEDVDFMCTERACAKVGIDHELHRCVTGEQAIDYLYRRGDYEDRRSDPCPQLVLLDLRLPGLDGYDVLKAIRENPQLKALPVVVLTTSTNPDEVRRLYELGANAYLAKPVEPKGLVDTFTGLRDFVLSSCLLPEVPGWG